MSTPPDTMHISTLKPAGPKPDWAPNIGPEMQVVIEKLMSYNDPALVTLSATDARKQHSPADAAMDVIKEHNIMVPPQWLTRWGKTFPYRVGIYTCGSIHQKEQGLFL